MSGLGNLEPVPIQTFRYLKGPLIDLRSPKEFSQGHWPGALNLPLFNNEERALVGKKYKETGQKEAIILGLELISPKIKFLIESLKKIKLNYQQISIDESQKYLKIYCWRGGMRSKSIGWLANILDLKPAILLGGYKAYRNWTLSQFKKKLNLKIIGGKTGSGKTDLLQVLNQRGISIIDLEGLANHRGSSFGSLGMPDQPTNEQYENKIGETLVLFEDSPSEVILVEDESANIGRCKIPNELFKQIKLAEVIEIKRSQEERVANLVRVYGNQQKELLIEATLRIKKRLGPQRTKKAIEAINQKNWSEACRTMLDYYDRCYDYDLSRKATKRSVDISGLTSSEAAEILVSSGFVNNLRCSQY